MIALNSSGATNPCGDKLRRDRGLSSEELRPGQCEEKGPALGSGAQTIRRSYLQQVQNPEQIAHSIPIYFNPTP